MAARAAKLSAISLPCGGMNAAGVAAAAQGDAQRRRSWYIGIVSNPFAVVTRPTYSVTNGTAGSSESSAANASVT